MTENQQPYEIKVGQHGKNCECSKCQPVKTTFCECETCQPHRPDKQESTKDRLKRFLAEAKDQDGELRCEDGSVYRGKVYEPEVSGESAKEYNRDEEGMPCDFCSHHVRAETSYCVTCDPENSNYEPCEFEAVAKDTIKKNDYEPDYRPGSIVSKQSDRIKELVDAHWNYQEKLLSAGQDKTQTFTWEQVMEMRKWDYTSSAAHFYGHGYEDAKGDE